MISQVLRLAIEASRYTMSSGPTIFFTPLSYKIFGEHGDMRRLLQDSMT